MKVLLKKAIITDLSSTFNDSPQDILIENGIISGIGKNIKAKSDQTIQLQNLYVSCGWMDTFSNFCDPGEEYKETLETGAEAAAAGGFTHVMVIPNTTPAISNKSQVEYIIQKSKELPVNIFPIGSVTKNIEGKEISEMYDMFKAGAIAFSDGTRPIQSSGILQKSLEYLLAIDAPLIQLPDDKSIGSSGLINEGEISTKLGLQGKPALSEELMVARDIELARYTGAKIHFTGISTAKSMEMIAGAKKDKLKVTCSATPYHLFFCDEDLSEYDTNLKVNPPIRTRKDRDALRKGVKSGLIDFIASHHQPQDWDHKVCEFEYAKNGMETLESIFGASGACGISVQDFVKMQVYNIRKVFNIAPPSVSVGAEAVLTLFNPSETFIFQETDINSKSRNNAFVGKKMKGRVYGIINRDKIILNK
jgi:dihydroorotase